MSLKIIIRAPRNGVCKKNRIEIFVSMLNKKPWFQKSVFHELETSSIQGCLYLIPVASKAIGWRTLNVIQLFDLN